MVFGTFLRGARLRADLTQEGLADQAGVSVRTIRDLERRRVRAPHRHTAESLAEALGLSGPDRTRFFAAAGQDSEPPAARRRPGSRRDRSRMAPAQLPAATAELFGRDPAMDLVRRYAAVARGRRRTATTISLHGPPGVGKTAFAIAAGTELRSDYPDGQLFADVGREEAGAGRGEAGAGRGGEAGAAAVVASFLRALGVAESGIPASLADRSALFRTVSDRLHLLIVLDEVADEDQLRPLMPAGSRCLVVVVARRPFAGLDPHERIALETLSEADSGEMLGSILGARAEAEPAAVRELVALCAGLPLALRLAADRLSMRPHWRVDRLVEYLRDEESRLHELQVGDLGVGPSIEAVHRRLDPADAEVFRVAAQLPGPEFTVGDVRRGCSATNVRRSIETLVDVGLLEPAGRGYRFHALTRIFARSL
ncbi:XRE family transcriptional regulator [Actinoplanes sp. NBRC 101535]|uniref:XRE family transcriptional regulator n=1 Tax=Actinoplanes sp. NBRC 101535 TaxID=3032196 RepID=UPI002553BCBF|nr:XRE family transcriptional regulator [Actinoplanes sp. NBRC 101535]